MLKGVQYPNNSIVKITDVGEGDQFALICQTDHTQCCRIPPYRLGDWYYPNGNVVPLNSVEENFYRNRSENGSVLLHRRGDSVYPTGLFCCEVPDNSSVTHTLCIGLLSLGRLKAETPLEQSS